MTFTPLPALRPHEPYSTICVRVIRKWEYRGPADNGPIQHIDLVLADDQGNSIYAEVPHQLADNFNSHIHEGHVYVLSRFRITNAKTSYKAVDGRYMIEFTYHTRVSVPKDPPDGFPCYVYNLVPFEDLPMLVGNITNFLDVLAVVIEVGSPEMMLMSASQEPTTIRNLVLRDANNTEIRMTLWGQRALQFSIDDVYNADDPKPIVTLFVGCLMKSYQARDYLSGSSACKWYFNPDIPEVQEFSNKLQNKRIEIRQIGPAPQQTVPTNPAAQQELKNLYELETIDPYEFLLNGCQCTVTISRLVPGVSWWFASCCRCRKACSPEGSGYRCYDCDCTSYRYKYKLLFMATDGTAEAEMICFGQIAQRIVGKSVESVMRSVRRDQDFPPDIAGIVSQKYTFALSMTNQSLYRRNKSYLVNSIISSYGRQRAIPHFSGASSNVESTSYKNVNTPSLPRESYRSESKDLPPAVLPVEQHIDQTPSKETTPPPMLHTPQAAEPHKNVAQAATSEDHRSKTSDAIEKRDTTRFSPRKRLTYTDTDTDEDSDRENFKRSRSDKSKSTSDAQKQSASVNTSPKEFSHHRTKAVGQKSGGSVSPSHKNK